MVFINWKALYKVRIVLQDIHRGSAQNGRKHAMNNSNWYRNYNLNGTNSICSAYGHLGVIPKYPTDHGPPSHISGGGAQDQRPMLRPR